MSHSTQTPSLASTPAQLFPSAAHVRADCEWLRTIGAQVRPSAFKVYVALLSFQGPRQSVYPSHSTIARETGLSVATVKRALEQLKALLLVSWVKRPPREDGGYSTNEYFVKLPKSELSPSLKVSHKVIQTPEGVINEPPSASEPLEAAEVEQLKVLGVKPHILRTLQSKPKACRHALRFIQVKSRWFARVPKKAGAVVDMIRRPEKYPLEAKPAPHAPVQEPEPTISATDLFILEMPVHRRDEIRAQAQDAPQFEALMAKYQSLPPLVRCDVWLALESTEASLEAALSGIEAQ